MSAQQSYSEAQYLGAAALALVAGAAFVYLGRHMRRTKLIPFFPVEVFRSAEALHPAPRPRALNRLLGFLLEILGWFMLVGFVVNLVEGILPAF